MAARLRVSLQICVMTILTLFSALSVHANDADPTRASADPSSFPQATDARIGGDETRTRFVVDIDRPVSFHVFVLADPYRIIVDLPQVNFDTRINELLMN